MKIKTYTIDRNLFMPDHNLGWGNGYVVLPEGHPLHGMGYYDLPETHEIDVHGGMTYAASASKCSGEVKEDLGLDGSEWVFGFDTAHYCDNPQSWPKSAVEDELRRFAAQFENMEPMDLFEEVKKQLENACAPQALIGRLASALGK